jgi:phenylalanyl-tRNA synthetase beta chain
MILPENTPIGVDIKEILGLDGGVIDFEITSNRADCFSVYGIAREASATFNVPLKPLELDFKGNSDNINNYLCVEVKDELCRRYIAKMVKNVKIKPSPDWMQQKLEEAGVRAINNMVDITNYVMLELGQPLHAFDYRDIADKKIIVRRADENEKLKTLDGNERTLDSSMLVIADDQRAVGVAGVMGGENSEIKEDTKAIVFESANFNGPNTRITSKKLGLRTEASSRFEKDLDPNLPEIAINRVCHLVELLGAGEVVGGVIDIYPEVIKPHNIQVSHKWINDFIGIDADANQMKSMLQSLGMKVEGEDTLNIEVPTFRQDVKINQDVAEEVARLYGYDKIPSVKMSGETVEAVWTEDQKLTKLVKKTMAASGLYEALTYSFVSPKVYDSINTPADSSLRNNVVIRNPLGKDFSVMRTTTLPSMLELLGSNYSRDNKNVGLFEIARVYIPSNEQLPDERDKLVIGIYGNRDFYNLKGIIENLLGELGIEKAEYVRETENPAFHPGRTAKLLIRKQEAGVIGEVHPDVTENYGIDERVYIAEIDLRLVFQAAKMERKYKALPKFPASQRDIAMLISDEVPASEIDSVINRAGKELIEKVELFDVYKGKQIPDGMKSVAYSITYRADRTLKDEEVNKVHEKVVNSIVEKFGAQLR